MKKLFTISMMILVSACQSKYYEDDYIYEEDMVESKHLYVKYNDEKTEKYSYHVRTPYEENIANENIMPEVYVIAATRATNKMLDDTRNIYSTKTTTYLFIKDIVKDEKLPNGIYIAENETRNIIKNSNSYTIVNNLDEADYILENSIHKVNIEKYNDKIIQYKMVIKDKDDKKINEYIEQVREPRNSRYSWW